MERMYPGIIGKKVGMSQVFTDSGKAEAVTVIEAGPCLVTQIKTSVKEGYEAVQMGFGTVKKLNKAFTGKAPDNRQQNRNSSGGADKILNRKHGHLHKVA